MKVGVHRVIQKCFSAFSIRKVFFPVWTFRNYVFLFSQESDLSGLSWSLLPSCGLKKIARCNVSMAFGHFWHFWAAQFLFGTSDKRLNIQPSWSLPMKCLQCPICCDHQKPWHMPKFSCMRAGRGLLPVKNHCAREFHNIYRANQNS